MKSARRTAVASFLLAATTTLAVSAWAQSIPEVPISTGPHSAAPVAQPAATWSAGSRLMVLPVHTGGGFASVLPVWLPARHWPAGEWATAREGASRFVIRERGRTVRPGSR
jgi:hypothetical protein